MPTRNPTLATANTVASRAATRWRASALPFLLLVGYLFVVKLVILGRPALFRSTAQATVFSWPWLAGIAVAGLLGTALSERLGLPPVWSAETPLLRRLWQPMAAGVLLGGLAIVVDLATGWTAATAREMGIASINIPFPASVIIYPGGAIIVDVLYYLLPIPLFVWLVSSVGLRGRGRKATFWTVALLCAAIEPLTQDLSGPHGMAAVTAIVFLMDYLLNAAQVVSFRRAGFGSAVALRISFYMVWHVLYGLR